MAKATLLAADMLRRVRDGRDLASGLYRAPRNAGPQTRAMYEYQDKCVALRCIPNLPPGSPVEAVAVEWSTDYVLIGSAGQRELVSVKHRDPGQHDWTFGRLKAKNVFRDLHAVWHAMGETGDFAFESNKGFDSDLASFVGNPDERSEPDEGAVRKIVNHLQVDTAEVLRFLRHFILRSRPLPSRHYIDAVAERDLAVVMEQLGMDPAFARQCFAALTSHIAAVSTQRPPDPAQRVTRLIGFMREIENRSGHDLDARLLTMAALRNIVTAESARTVSRRPASLGDAANIHPRAAYGVEALPLAMAVLDYAPVLADIGLDHFAGREWLVAAIEDTASADSVVRTPRTGRYVLVGGGAGLGKTTLAGWLSHRWGCACHFTGVSGGRDAKVALQSLAAQLIIRYGLEEEFAAGGILAGWAGDPARFPRILAAAAERAREQGGQVRIVVDGLDEAEGDGIALDLPATLPEGVCIVATYRDGTAPCRLPGGEHVSTFTIMAFDPANREDIRQFLTTQARDDTIAARLATAGVAPDDFVSQLTERSTGVWVYLRYVLSQIRTGPWDAADFEKLPVGLAAYYRQQVTGRRSDPAFHSEDLVVLATLAVAQQPMTLDQVSRITRLDSGIVRTLINHRYRPFLTVDAISPGLPRYSIYHASLREFLHGSPGQPGDPLDMSDLREATQDAHRRIAHYYLDIFGGLDTGLSELHATPGLADHDDRYALRHLPIHLDCAGRQDDLRALVTSGSPGSPLGSIWADAHDRAGTLDSYLAAIDLVRSAAERETDMLITAARPAPSLAEETQYALIAANMISRSNAIPVTLLEALVRSGTWDSTRALAHAMRHHEPVMRASALIALIPGLEDPLQAAQARENALSAVAAIASEEVRAKLLGKLEPHLDVAQLERALTVATEIRTDLFRAQALTSLSTRLQGSTLTQALSCKEHAVQNLFRISAAIGDAEQRAGAMAGAAHMMEGPARTRALDRALEVAVAITDSWAMERELGKLAGSLDHAQLDRALETAIASRASSHALIDLAPYLTPGQLDRALAAAAASKREWECGRALAGLAHHMNHEQLERALDAVSHITDEGIRATAQVRISHHAQIPVSGHVIDSAMADASKTEDPDSRRFEFVSLARHLEGLERIRAIDGALDAAIAVSDQNACGRSLRDLAPYLLPGQLERALDAAAAIGDEAGRGLALTGLAQYLEEPARTDAIIGALNTVTAVNAERNTGQVRVELVALARELENPARHRITQGLLGAAAACQDDISRRLNLEELAPLLDPAQLSRAVKAAAAIRDDYAREGALASLAPYLNPAQLSCALEAVTAPGFCDFQARARALASLVPHLHGQVRAKAIEETLEAARAARDSKARWPFTHDDESVRAELIITVAPYLDAAQLARAQQVADSFTDNGCKVSALATLATYLEDPARTRALDNALRAASRIESARPWGWALADLAPHLRAEVRASTLAQALEAAPAVPDETVRAGLVITVASYLDNTQLTRALQVADSFTDHSCRVSVLSSLAIYLEEPARSRALEKAVEAVGAISDGRYLAWASAHLIQHLQGAARSQAVQKALNAAAGIKHQESCARALADISAYLEGPARTRCLDNALDTAVAIQDERYQARTLAFLASDLDIAQLGRALVAATSLPYLGENRPCEQIFRRISFLATGTARSDIVLLIRRFYRALPPREALLAVTSAAVEALIHVGGSEAATRLFESICQTCYASVLGAQVECGVLREASAVSLP
jgi:hypothetical protein